MQAEEPPKQSFFDDDDINFKFGFRIPTAQHVKEIQTPCILKDTFTMGSNLSNIPRNNTYGLHRTILCHYQNTFDLAPDSVLELSHSRLGYLRPGENNLDYGFSLSKNGNTFSFYSHDKHVIDNWYEALKKCCVLTTFHDDYKAIKMIGRGSFAKVYLVESKETGQSFAVKAFTKDAMAVSNKNNAKPSLLNEIEIMRAVDHENIIKLYETYETEKSVYLVLELIQGKSLYDFLKKQTYKQEASPTKILNLARSLLDAMAYLASKGIMHRDLKPDNILLDKGEKVKIVDFGLATFIDVPSYIFKKCGTPGYIAPEVFKYDEKNPETFYNDRCDVFSIGCLFHAMLFNSQFFEGGTAAEILRANRKYDAEYPTLEKIRLEFKNPNSKIVKDGVDLVLRLVEVDQRKRISATQALSHPYFTPMPIGMQKVIGANEFVIDAISKYSQNEIYSPTSPIKHSATTLEQPYSPLTPQKVNTYDRVSPLLPNNKDRFVREDSLYLDLGKPELNGRMDTLTSGSTNNSLLLANRLDSCNNVSSPLLPSNFSTKKSATKPNTRAYKPLASGNSNQSVLKAAIFRNMQKNNSEGIRDEEGMKNRIEAIKASRNSSEDSPPKNRESRELAERDLNSSPTKMSNEERMADVCNEDSGVQTKVAIINQNTHGKHPSKLLDTPMRRAHPFAPGNLIIPKNSFSGM